VSAPGPSPEELRAQLEDQMRRLTVEDVIVQTVVTLVNVGARRLGLAGDPEERDLEQGRQAIEGVRGLLPLVPTAEAPAVRDALSQLQITYARQARVPGAGAEPTPGPTGAPPGAPPPPGAVPTEPGRPSPAEEAERAKARARIWTPPGS
jgi:hypothetical protein